MSSPLTSAELLLLLAPITLPIALFIPVRTRSEIAFTDSGKRYRKMDSPESILLVQTRWFWPAFCLIIALLALWAISVAVNDALRSGVISLPGTRRSPRPVVHWQAAWAYLLGLSLVFLSTLLPWLSRTESKRLWLVLASVVAGVCGYALYFLSPQLSSFKRAGNLFAIVSSLAIVLWVNRRFGKLPALLTWSTLVACLVYLSYVAGA